jgi:hypothetical protein
VLVAVPAYFAIVVVVIAMILAIAISFVYSK